jgi:hypothetical protein
MKNQNILAKMEEMERIFSNNSASKIFEIVSFRHKDPKELIDNIKLTFPPEIVRKCLSQDFNLAFLALTVFPTKDEYIARLIEYLIECGIPINSEKIEIDGKKITLISEAIVCGHIITLKTLLRLGATNIGYIDPKWFNFDESENVGSPYNMETIKRSKICLSIINILGYVSEELFESLHSDLKHILKDRKDRHNLSICFLCIARITGNRIIDKNLFIKMAKDTWRNRRKISV